MNTRIFMLLGAAVLALQAVPVLAEDAPPPCSGPGPKGQMFEQKDTNGDGVVSKDEFLAFSQAKAEERFGKMDADGDGKITREEAQAAHEKMREQRKDRWEGRKEMRQERMQGAE